MTALLLIHIPIIAALIWSAWRTYRRGGRMDAAIIVACGTIVTINAVVRHFEMGGCELPCGIVIIQQILSSLIVPFVYLFFCMQVNVKLMNAYSIALFSVISLLLFPNINVITATTPLSLPSHYLDDTTLLHELTASKSLNIITDSTILQYTIADLIITIQAMITTIRIAPLFHKLRAYGLQPSRDVKVFTAWWCLAAVFIVFSSVNSDTNHTDPIINIICHVTFMIVMVGIFFLLGRGINFNPVPVKHNDTDAFAEKSKEMARQLMTMIAEQRIHLQSGYSVDTAIDALRTNRTYFYRMLHEEFGSTFSELMNRERIKHIKVLLTTSNDSISSIADSCGFKNTSYMIKIFKQLEGCTPSEWKKQHA